TAHTLEAGLPETAGALEQAARRALDEAIGVVTSLENELDGHTAAVTAQSPAAQAPAISPASLMSSAMPALGGLTSGMSGLGSGGMGAMSPLAGGLSTIPADFTPLDQAVVEPQALG